MLQQWCEQHPQATVHFPQLVVCQSWGLVYVFWYTEPTQKNPEGGSEESKPPHMFPGM